MTRNRIGPNLVLCGTPAFVVTHSDKDLPNLTRCLRFDKKLHIQGNNDLRTHKKTNLVTKMLRLMRSKALLKSRKQIRKYWPGVSKFNSQL